MKKYKIRLVGIFILCFFACITRAGQITDSVSQRPNIIFLLTDDQRFDALGCMGNTQIETPEIDKLAAKGAIFMNHYNPTAICMGSRAVIMTGMYEHKTGCNFQHGPLSEDKFQLSYPVLIRQAGYFTGFAGKFGFAVTPSPEDPSAYKTNNVMPMAEFDWWRGWPNQGSYTTAENEFMADLADEYPHVSGALGAAAIEFVDSAATQNKPFCLSLSFKAPHGPVNPDPNYNHVYAGKSFTPPGNYWKDGAEHLPRQAKLGRQYLDLGDHWKPESYNESLSRYYQLIYGVDVAVGMLMEKLEKEGLLDNTIIIYTTDNGYFCGSHAMGGKVLPYEEGSRAPLIICDPNSELAGKVINPLTGNQDMAPTILDYAGVEIPENMDGVSLRPILNGEATSVKEHQMIIQAWGSNPTHVLSVLQDNYKYIYWFYGGVGLTPQEELYDLANDPGEMHNLVGNTNYAGQLESMQSLYDAYVENWKTECTKVSKNNYVEYGILYDRHISWEEKIGIMKASRDPKNVNTVVELAEEDIDLRVFPNPAQTTININIQGSRNGKLSIDLFDLKGRHLSQFYDGNMDKQFNRSFPLNWPSGIYLFQFCLDGQYHTEQVIFE